MRFLRDFRDRACIVRRYQLSQLTWYQFQEMRGMLSRRLAPAMGSTPSELEMQFAAIRCLRRTIPMLRFVRVGLAAAALGLAMTAAIAADKPFKQVALEEAAIKLEAQIKGDAGVVTRAAAALRRDADAAFQKNDFRAGIWPQRMAAAHYFSNPMGPDMSG